METTPAPSYALVELMGHRQVCGQIAEATRYGATGIEITTLGPVPRTHFYAGSALYAVHPCSREQAERAARTSHVPWQLEAPADARPAVLDVPAREPTEESKESRPRVDPSLLTALVTVHPDGVRVEAVDANRDHEDIDTDALVNAIDEGDAPAGGFSETSRGVFFEDLTGQDRPRIERALKALGYGAIEWSTTEIKFDDIPF